jgi:hypothetical protein
MLSDRIMTHNIDYFLTIGTDRDGKKTFDTLKIERARLVLATGKAKAQEGATTSDSVRLYIDSESKINKITIAKITIENEDTGEKNTHEIETETPILFDDFKPTLNDKVVYKNLTYNVVEILPAFGANGIHHYEVGLK